MVLQVTVQVDMALEVMDPVTEQEAMDPVTVDTAV